jgi:hypothetical protein
MLDRAARLGTRHGIREGVVGGNQVWLAIGAAAFGLRLIRLIGSRRALVVTEHLNPGEALIIRHLSPPEG